MSVLPRTSDHSTKPSTANVVTLMPPAVDAGPAPMNISVVITSRVGSFMPPMSTVLKPAVLGVTPWNHPARILSKVSSGPSVAGFVHSNVITTRGPNTSSAAVVIKVIFVCNDQWALRRMLPRCAVRRKNSTRIGNPSPPMMKPIETLITTTGSVTKPARLSG